MLTKKEYLELVSKIKLEALGLGLEETLNTTCPLCQGGQSKDKSFSLTKVDGGLLYNCFRASCGIRGFLGNDKMVYSEKKKKPFRPIFLERPLEPLSDVLFDALCNRYNILPDILEEHNWKHDYLTHRIAIPIYNIFGRRVGYTCKALSKNNKPKNIEYWEKETNKINAPLRRVPSDKCILVEDSISSLSLLPFCNSIALLGTTMDFSTASLISRVFKKIVIALDADTWKNKQIPSGIVLRNRYHTLFDSVDVLRISKDPKDMTMEQKSEEIFSKI